MPYVRPNIGSALKSEFRLLKERSFLPEQSVIYRTFGVSALKIVPIKEVPYKYYVPNIQYMCRTFRECAKCLVNMLNVRWLGQTYVNGPNVSRTLVFSRPFGVFWMPNVRIRPKLENHVSLHHCAGDLPSIRAVTIQYILRITTHDSNWPTVIQSITLIRFNFWIELIKNSIQIEKFDSNSRKSRNLSRKSRNLAC